MSARPVEAASAMSPIDAAVFWAANPAAYNGLTARLQGLDVAALDGLVVEHGVATARGAVRAYVVDLESPVARLGASSGWVSALLALASTHVVLDVKVLDHDARAAARVDLVADGDLCDSAESLALLERVRAAARRGVTVDGVALREGEDYAVAIAPPGPRHERLLPLFERFDRAGVAWAFLDVTVLGRREDPARAALQGLVMETVLRSLGGEIPTLDVSRASGRADACRPLRAAG